MDVPGDDDGTVCKILKVEVASWAKDCRSFSKRVLSVDRSVLSSVVVQLDMAR